MFSSLIYNQRFINPVCPVSFVDRAIDLMPLRTWGLRQTYMHIPEFEEIIEPNDQTRARAEHLDALRTLIA